MPVPGPELDISQFGDGIVKEVILTGLQADSKQGQCEDPGTYSAALSWGACLPPPRKSPLCPGEHSCPRAVNALSWGAHLSSMQSQFCPAEHAYTPEVIFASLVLYYEISSSVSKLGNPRG